MTLVNHTVCPCCGHEHDRSSEVVSKVTMTADESRMTPGSVTMCIKCGEFSVMGDDEMLRKPTKDETNDIDNDPRVKFLREAWRDTWGYRNERRD